MGAYLMKDVVVPNRDVVPFCNWTYRLHFFRHKNPLTFLAKPKCVAGSIAFAIYYLAWHRFAVTRKQYLSPDGRRNNKSWNVRKVFERRGREIRAVKRQRKAEGFMFWWWIPAAEKHAIKVRTRPKMAWEPRPGAGH